jgi:hypothetical protein
MNGAGNTLFLRSAVSIPSLTEAEVAEREKANPSHSPLGHEMRRRPDVL